MYRDRGHSWWSPDDHTRFIRYLTGVSQSTQRGIVLWQIPVGNTRMRTMDNTWGHYQDTLVEWLLDDPTGEHLGAYRAAGVIGLLFGAGAAGATCPCDGTGDGVTNPAAINGNDRESLNADDDGGYLRERLAAYYASGIPVQAR